MFDLTRSVAEEFLEVYKGVTADYGRYAPRGIRPGTHRHTFVHQVSTKAYFSAATDSYVIDHSLTVRRSEAKL